jgi:hypothetical protein
MVACVPHFAFNIAWLRYAASASHACARTNSGANLITRVVTTWVVAWALIGEDRDVNIPYIPRVLDIYSARYRLLLSHKTDYLDR